MKHDEIALKLQGYSLDEIWDSFIEQIALYEERAEQTDALSIEDRLAIQDQILKLEKQIMRCGRNNSQRRNSNYTLAFVNIKKSWRI